MRSRRSALVFRAWKLRRDKAKARAQAQLHPAEAGRSASCLGRLPLAPYGLRGGWGGWRTMDPKEKSRASCRGVVHPAVEAPGARLALPLAALAAGWFHARQPGPRGPCAVGRSEDAALGVQGPHAALRRRTRAEGFVPPNGAIHPSPLWFLATTLIFPL